MTELELLVDLHKDGERQGPGSEEETLKAFSFIDLENFEKLKIADIGCGTGGQTITLAKHTGAQITAVDLFPEFLNVLNNKANELELLKNIKTVEASMDNLAFHDEEFDVIWSEGAIYNIGFERGLQEWKKYLKRGGYIAVSEATWLTKSRPKEIEEYWNREYADINMAANRIKLIEDNGYSLVGYFVLKQSSWMKNYYEPIKNRLQKFLERHNNSESAKQIYESSIEEIEIYEKYKDYYSYGFYIAKKI
ncbi:MAG: class I SAM-dependent methyltransferase [Melioribacteraceae bacterium]|nr:class I SAM-dependent methyltransferase [Melioribacteraceae bacterium]